MSGSGDKKRVDAEPPVDDLVFEDLADQALGPDPEDELLEAADPLRQSHEETSAQRAAKQAAADDARAQRIAACPNVHNIISMRRKRAFLIALAETGIVGQACARAGWSRATAVSLRKADAEFSRKWDEALDFAADSAEAAAFRRGVHGVHKDVYFKGQVVGKETIYSDRMLEMILKARRPEQFRDSVKQDVAVTGGVLVVPQAPNEGDWERGATAGQAKFREAPEDL